jgi:hypothetical protein
MTVPTKVNFKIYQGSTFTKVFRWETLVKKYASITNISKTAPAIITAAEHGLPSGWRFKVSSVLGMREINADDYLIATDTSANTITVGDLNSSSFSAYTSGGIVEYYTPKSLLNFSARLQIREKLSSTTVFLELTSTSGGIIIDNAQKTITINITAEQTALFTAKNYVYSLELYSLTEVFQLTRGTLTTDFEITR